jgi:hypothetical protein
VNRIILTSIALATLFFVCTATLAQEEPASAKPPLDSKKKRVKALAETTVKPHFVGTVTEVNLSERTIAAKGKVTVITFDVANPVLKGYKSIEQIKRGDRVAISYIPGGVRIATAGATGAALPKEQLRAPEPVRPVPDVARPKQETTKTAKINKGRPVRVRERTNSTEFRDVDNNGDGRISPVELGTVVPDLTLEKFKTYDRNGDGTLSSSEYSSLKKSFPNGR